MPRYDWGVSVGFGDIEGGSLHPIRASRDLRQMVQYQCVEFGIKFVASLQAQNEGFERVYETEPRFLDSYMERAGAGPKSQAPASRAGAEPKLQAQATPNQNIRDRTQVLRLVMQ